MIGNAKKSIVLSTFDLRPDDSGMKIIAALYTAAERGVQVQILIDGIYQKLFLEKSPVFQALAAHQNVEVGIYNPVMNRKVKGKETKLINREDMLALTRRMTVKRTSRTRIAGGYLDMDGYIDGTFNTGFLKLSPDEKEKNLQIAKVIPFADTNQNLKEYAFSSEKMKGDSMWKLLMGMRVCGLKNDALMETFYEIVGEQYQAMGDYAVYVFHDRYDIPAKGKDHVRQGESEEMFEYLICAICPVSGDYEPGEPECGFLFPAFMDGAAALNYVDVYQKDQAHPHTELLKMLGVW